jgi:hypothetical protein
MTFLEAFHSGHRFKLPNDYLGEVGAWPDDWWWIKHDNDHVRIINIGNIVNIHNVDNFASDPSYYRDIMEHRAVYTKCFESDEWYLNEVDLFNAKVEQVINE